MLLSMYNHKSISLRTQVRVADTGHTRCYVPVQCTWSILLIDPIFLLTEFSSQTPYEYRSLGKHCQLKGINTLGKSFLISNSDHKVLI